MRRRLRAVLRSLDQQSSLPPGLLLVGGRPQLIEHSFDRLTSEMSALIDQIRRSHASNA